MPPILLVFEQSATADRLFSLNGPILITYRKSADLIFLTTCGTDIMIPYKGCTLKCDHGYLASDENGKMLAQCKCKKTGRCNWNISANCQRKNQDCYVIA